MFRIKSRYRIRRLGETELKFFIGTSALFQVFTRVASIPFKVASKFMGQIFQNKGIMKIEEEKCRKIK